MIWYDSILVIVCLIIICYAIYALLKKWRI
jgi:hypothetical protein